MSMQKQITLFCLCSFILTVLPKTTMSSDPADALFIAIAQGKAKQVKKILDHGVSINIQRDPFDGNTPLMEAIIAIGEKLLEMETATLAKELSNPKHMADDFRSFLRSAIISLIIGVSASEIHSNIERIHNEDDDTAITLLQSLARAFLPVISRSAYIWCAYSILDYGILIGQKPPENESDSQPDGIEKFKKTIDILLANPALNINQANHHGQSALSLIRFYKDKIKTEQLKIMLYQLEQRLLSEGAYSYQNAHSHAQNYVQKTD